MSEWIPNPDPKPHPVEPEPGKVVDVDEAKIDSPRLLMQTISVRNYEPDPRLLANALWDNLPPFQR